MPIEFSCPGCKRIYSVADRLADTRVKCKGCGTWMRVPLPPSDDVKPPQPADRDSSTCPASPGPCVAQTKAPPRPAPSPAPAGLPARLRACLARRQFLTIAVAAGVILLLAALVAIGVVAFWPVRQSAQPGQAGATVAPGQGGTGQSPRDLSPWTPNLTAQTMPPLPAQCEGILLPSSPVSPYLLLLRPVHDRTAPPFPAQAELVVYDLRARRELSCLETVGRRSPAGCLSPDGCYQAELVPGSPMRLVVRSTQEDVETASLVVSHPLWYDFASPQRLVVLDGDRSVVTVWNHHTGRLEREIPLPRRAYPFAQGAVSPDGRRMVVSGGPYRAADGRLTGVIHVLDLQAGAAINDLWLAGGDGFPVVEGFAFTGDGSRLAALFRMIPAGSAPAVSPGSPPASPHAASPPASFRIVAWETASGAALFNCALDGRRLGPHFTCRPVIQWTADARSWFVDGRTFVQADTGAATGDPSAAPAAWARILGPDLVLVADQVGLPVRYELRTVRPPGFAAK